MQRTNLKRLLGFLLLGVSVALMASWMYFVLGISLMYVVLVALGLLGSFYLGKYRRDLVRRFARKVVNAAMWVWKGVMRFLRGTDRWIESHLKQVIAVLAAVALGLASGLVGIIVFRVVTQSRPIDTDIPDVWTGQWHGNLIGADWAYDAGYRGQGVTICLLDTGVDYYTDAFENIAERGISFLDGPENDYYDEYGHGTHLGSIMVSKERQFMGIAPDAELINVKVLSDYGYGWWQSVIRGIDYCMSEGVDIITMSFGGIITAAEASGVHDAIKRAQAADILLVASAGNLGSMSDQFGPGGWSDVITVTAVDWDLAKPSWAAKGPHVDLAAPGVAVYATCTGLFADTLYFRNGYRPIHCMLSGTSTSAPIVAAAAAVIKSSPIPTYADWDEDGQWGSAELRSWIEKTAYDVGYIGRDDEYGYGIIDLGAALGMGLQAPRQYDPEYIYRGMEPLFVQWGTNTTQIQLIIE